VVEGILVQALLATDYMQIDSDIIESEVRPTFDLPTSRNQQALPSMLELQHGFYRGMGHAEDR